MIKLLSLAFAAALCLPVAAQRSGSTNTNAPTIKQSIETGDATISLDYTSITWAQGRWHERATDKENGARARERINQNAVASPLATLKTSVDLMCGDAHLAAGDYKVYFTIGDDLAWSINFQGKDDKVQTVKLALDNSGHEQKRLLLCLYAADDEGAGVYVAFGKEAGMLSLKPHQAK